MKTPLTPYPGQRCPAPRTLDELEPRLRRDARSVAGPSPALRGRVLRALSDERARAASPPPMAAATRARFGPRLLGFAAAAAVVLLLWDPFRPQPSPSAPSPNELVGRLLALSDPTPLVDVVDRPLRAEMGHLVADTTRVAGGVAERMARSPLARLLVVAGGRSPR